MAVELTHAELIEWARGFLPNDPLYYDARDQAIAHLADAVERLANQPD